MLASKKNFQVKTNENFFDEFFENKIIWTESVNLFIFIRSLTFQLKHLHYFGHAIRRTESIEKYIILRKTEGRRPKEKAPMRWMDHLNTICNADLKSNIN